MNRILLLFVSLITFQTTSKEGEEIPSTAKKNKEGETYHFQAKISRVMNLFINSLYTNDEIFIRELLSNASDALTKVRTLSLTDSSIELGDLEISIEIDWKNKILTIQDTGIGMTKEELIKNLGTIAESGTSELLKKIDEGGEISTLIGQFGVGFYSAFLVSDRIVVISRGVNSTKQYAWVCEEAEQYTVYEDVEGKSLRRGTRISLQLKKKALGYLSVSKIKEVVKKYGEFYRFPIYLRYDKEVNKEVEEDEGEEGEEGESKKTMIKTTEQQNELLNANKPIWKRDQKEVTAEDYKEFYKSLTNDRAPPLAWKHFNIEGNTEFSGIMFIPNTSSFDATKSEEDGTAAGSLALHVKNVFVTGKAELLPPALDFVRGVVDAEGLPLNISREVLQNNKIIRIIQKRLIGKFLELLAEMSKERNTYEQFYETYSPHLRGYIRMNPTDTRFYPFLRFYSSLSKRDRIPLSKYVEAMKEGQKRIYYMAGETLLKIRTSVYIEALLEKGYPVLYLTDPMDEPSLVSIKEFSGLEFQDSAKEGLSLGESKEKLKELRAQFKPLSKWIRGLLKNHVEAVRISQRLSQSACALVAKKGGWNPNMERVMSGQSGSSSDPMTSFFRTQKKIFEINPTHPLIIQLNKIVSQGKTTKNHEKYLRVLFDTAAIKSGISVKQPIVFASNIEGLLYQAFGLEKTVPIEEYKEVDETKRKDIERREKYEKEIKENIKKEKQQKKEEKKDGVEEEEDFESNLEYEEMKEKEEKEKEEKEKEEKEKEEEEKKKEEEEKKEL